MCELFGVSASGPTRAEALLREFRLRGGLTADNSDGWGLACWDGVAFRIVKEPEAAARSALFSELCDTVRSRLVIAHVRKARHPPINTMTNTHPFTRTCCDREWVFAHNGLVPGVVALERERQNPVCRPTGETDSEHAFCHVLAYLAEALEAARGGDDADWIPALAAESEMLTSFGKFNFLMSDGEHLIAYGHDRLHYTEQHDARPSIDHPLCHVTIATEPLNAAKEWIALEPGELRVYRSGRLAGRMLTRPTPTLTPSEDHAPELKSASLLATPTG
jgi:predicted glutamine amidotransferase